MTQVDLRTVISEKEWVQGEGDSDDRVWLTWQIYIHVVAYSHMLLKRLMIMR